MRAAGARRSAEGSARSCPGGALRRKALTALCGLALVAGFAAVVPTTAHGISNPIVQTFYVPFPEDQILAMLQAVESGGPGSTPTDPITSYITITTVGDDTIIYYDQWENGFDVDIANTLDVYNASTNPDGTQIWGDGDTSNGAPPGIASDLLDAGTVIQLENDVTTTTRQSVIDFDGGDKVAASKTIALTRTSWAGATGTLFAGCVEVYDTNNWGTDYRSPVGTDAANDYDMFEYSAVTIMAGKGGATISVDANNDGDYSDGGDLNGVTLDEGESTYVTGIQVGARVVSDNPVQVDLFTGDIGSNYESRDSALLPTDLWSDSYYTPVSTANISGYGDERTTVWLYNPAGSAITVTYARRNTLGNIVTSTVSVPAGGVAKQILENATDGTGSHFYSTGNDFYAYSTTDSASSTTTDNQAWDWSFTLTPEDSLTTQVLIGLGLGQDPEQPNTENGNPIWVTTVGNGDTAATVYVDYDGDPTTGSMQDASGYWCDDSFTLRELEQERVYVVSDPIVVDATSSGSTGWFGSSATLTISHTTGTDSDRLMLVGVAIGNDATTQRNVSTVTYGGTPLTYMGRIMAPAGGGGSPEAQPQVEIWALDSPSSGTANVVVTLPSAATMSAGVTTFSAVDVSSGLTSALGSFTSASASSGTTQSVAVSTSEGQMVFDVVAAGSTSNTWYSAFPSAFTVGAGQTQEWAQLSLTAGPPYLRLRGASSTETASGTSTTMSWTTTTSYPWAIAAVPINAVGTTKIDQTGLLVYTLDTDTKLAVAWGQDPPNASASTPGLDVGTNVPPMPEFEAAKDGVLYDSDDDPSNGYSGDNDGDGYLSAGDVIEYPITVYNVSRVPVPNVIVWDEIPTGTTYVTGSTAIDGTPVSDDGSGTPFPLDGSGLLVTSSLAVGDEITVTFRVTIDDPVAAGTVAIANGGEGRALGHDDPVDDDAYILGQVSDYVWFDADNDGVQDATEDPIYGVEVRLLDENGQQLYNDAGAMIVTTDEYGNYLFAGLPAGTYIVEFVAPDGTLFTTRDATTDDLDSDADTTVGSTYGQTAVITLDGGEKDYDADAGLILENPTLSVVSSFDSYRVDKKVTVTWETSGEVDTAGFYLERLAANGESWTRVNDELMPAMLESPAGGTYTLVDDGTGVNWTSTYRLVEVETTGNTIEHGPYTVTPQQNHPDAKTYREISRGADSVRTPKNPSVEEVQRATEESRRTIVASAEADRLRIELTAAGLYTLEASDLAAGFRLSEDLATKAIREGWVQLSRRDKAVAYRASADGSALYFYGTAYESPYTDTNVYWLELGKGTTMGGFDPGVFVDEEATATTLVVSTTTSTTTTLAPTTTASSTTTTTLAPTTTDQTATTTAGVTTTTGSPGEAGSTTTSVAPTTTLPVSTTATTSEPSQPTVEPDAETSTTVTTEDKELVRTSFVDVVHAEQDVLDVPSLFHDPKADIWMWDYLVAGNASLASKSFTVDAPDAVSGIALVARLHGLVTTGTAGEHRVQVKLNGVVLGETSWTGTVANSLKVDVPEGVLRAGSNQVEVTALLGTGVPYSLVGIDSVDVRYVRSLTAVDDQLQFSIGKDGLVRVGGLTGPGVWILDITDARVPVRVEAGQVSANEGVYSVEFQGVAKRDYLVTVASGAARPSVVTAVDESKLRSKKNKAKYVVITSAGLEEAAARLAWYRGKGRLTTMVVTTTEIYDEFNYGIASPTAIKDFIEYAATKWKKKARFVVLVGEGSYDYKDYTGNGDCVVPPLMVDTDAGVVVSDVALADFKGADGAPDVAIGRIPALTPAEVTAAVNKIIRHETTRVAKKKRTVVMVADNADEAGDFATDSDSLASLIPAKVPVSKAFLAEDNLDEVRSTVLSSFWTQTVLITYIGHAGVDLLADEGILTKDDVSSLSESKALPVLTAYTCVAGQYGLPGVDSLGESLTMREKAGAIAVWAPTAPEENEDSVQLGQLFTSKLFSKSRNVRLGMIIRDALKAGADAGLPQELLSTYCLLGDPALKVTW